ncbi:hypothetical protein [Prosthecomicrobium sp. N25]|uniref:hypothetical protein n=1 Tax=Prosthecomicrobium sp. N25 TaxID=3129254 RepID=UPI0030785C14
MALGGKREGAGRKPKLSPIARIDVGAQAEAAMQKHVRKQAYSEMDAQLEREGVDLSEVRKNRKIIKLSRRKLSTGEMSLSNFNEALDEARHVIQTEYETDKPFIQRRSLKRIYGVRLSIFAEVAASASQRYGMQISTRMVERCWEEYLRLLPRPKPDAD